MAPQSPSATSAAPSNIPPDMDQAERYKRLKRRFEEIEQESSSSEQSNERNVRLREERDVILQELQQLENHVSPPLHDPPFSQNDNIHSRNHQKTPTRAHHGESHSLRSTMNEDVADEVNTSGSRSTLAQGSSRGREEMSGGKSPRQTRRTSRRSGSQPSPSPKRLAANHNHNEDVQMVDGTRSTVSSDSSRHPSGSEGTPESTLARAQPNGRPAGQGVRTGADLREPGSSPNSKPNGSSRLTDSAALIRAASAAARAEANEAALSLADTTNAANSIPKSPPTRPPPTRPASNSSEDVEMDQRKMTEQPSASPNNTSSISGGGIGASSNTPASMDLLAQAAQEATSATPTANSAPVSKSPDSSLNPPSFESIVRVAEAAVAAQVAAQAASSPSAPASSSNLDPALPSQSTAAATSPPPTPSSTSSPPPPSQPASNGTKPDASSSPPSTSHLSGNPYASLALQKPGSLAPVPAPFMIPYPYFFPPPNSPHPNTPVTPSTPAYPIYNPYYYLPPVMPGPNGMYPPPPPNFMPPSLSPPRPTEPPRPKAKRLKAHAVVSKSCSIPVVPRGPRGKPMLPLNVGIMTVICLGEVCMREHFHTERYIFPVGYEVTRRYLSTVDRNTEVVYHCTILDGGDGPKFQIIPSDRPDKPVIAGTATGAWSNIVKQANAIRNRQHSNSVSGPDFFGLGQNTIKHLIQELPNANRLRDYVWQNFVEGGPLGGRHAAVIPALPEEYDASLPLGPYYPKRDLSNPNVPRGMAHYPQHIIAQAEAERVTKATGVQEGEAGPSGAMGQGVAGPSGLQHPLHPQLHQHPHPHPHPSQHPPPPHPQIQPGLGLPPGVDMTAAAALAAAANTLRAAASASVASGPGPSSTGDGVGPRQDGEHNGGEGGLADGLAHAPNTFAGLMNAYPVTGPTLGPLAQQQQQPSQQPQTQNGAAQSTPVAGSSSSGGVS